MKKEKETKQTQDNHLSPQSQQNQGAKEDSAPATVTQTDNHQNGFPNRGPQQRSQNKSK